VTFARYLAATVVVAVWASFGTANPAKANAMREAQWHLEFLHVAEAHGLTQGEQIVVAVIDTGVDARHPDLRGRVLPGVDLTTSVINNGWLDEDGHGTAMSGLVVARGRTLGIAPASRVLPIRDTRTGSGFENHIAEGIEWAIVHGAQIICIASVTTDQSRLKTAVERAIAKDIVVVAGAGNYPISTVVGFPAAYPGVLAIAGVDKNGEQASISVEGPEVDLAAPAVQILSTDIRGPGHSGYRTGTGTSDATAIAAGAAALVRARFPDLSAGEVIHRLTATADDKGIPGRDNEYGYGVVNLVRALTADVPPLPTSPPPTTSTRANPPGEPTPLPWPLILAAVALIGGLATLAVVYARRR